MKKQLLFEAKRILLPLIVFTVIACVLYVLTALNSDFISVRYDFPEMITTIPLSTSVPGNPVTYIPASFPCNIVLYRTRPAIFLPHEKAFGRPVVRLPPYADKAHAFAHAGRVGTGASPYTISYWLGFTAIALSENLFDFLPTYPCFLPLSA